MIRSSAALLLLGISLLVLVACGSSPTPTTELQALKETVVFSDLNWDSAQYQNRIAMFIVQHGYGYSVDSVFGGTGELWQSLVNGDTHVTMEVCPNKRKTGRKQLPVGQ